MLYFEGNAFCSHSSYLMNRFLWVVRQLDHLARIGTSVDIAMLKVLPRGLDKTYNAILSRLEDEDQKIAGRILQLIMFSCKPLDLSELVDGIAIEPGIHSLRSLQKNRLRRPTDVFEICGSLIRQSPTTEKLELAHYSVYEFLLAPNLQSGEKNKFHFFRPKASLKIATSCIIYLSVEEFGSKEFSSHVEPSSALAVASVRGAPISESPLLDYAGNYWWNHLSTVDPISYSKLWPVLERFFNQKRGNFQYWASILRYTHGEYKYPVGLSPLHVAALHGLALLASMLLMKYPRMIESRTSDGRTALHVATENGQDLVTELLIGEKASLEASDNAGRRPLHLATERGDEFAVKQLLKAGADVNAALADGQTPLTIALENQWDGLVEMMLKTARADSSLEDGRSLLHLAAQTGNKSHILALLKNKKGDVNARDANKWTPLHFAVENGYLSVVEILLANGAFASALDKKGWTPLHAAIQQRHLACATLLLQTTDRNQESQLEIASRSTSRQRDQAMCANRDSAVKYGKSLSVDGGRDRAPWPLFLAVSNSYEDGVQLLLGFNNVRHEISQHDMAQCLDRSLEFSDTTVLGTLLGHAPVYKVHEALCKAVLCCQEVTLSRFQSYLVETEANYYYHFKEAIKSKSVEVMRYLMKLTMPDRPQRMIDLLGEAIHTKEIEVVRQLIDRIHDISLSSSNNCTPLRLAIQSGEYPIAALLMERGAKDSTCLETGETALHALAEVRFVKGQKEAGWIRFANALIEQGGDIFALDKIGQSMCHKAAASDNEPMLMLVLQNGVQLDQLDVEGDTPIHIAIRHSHLAILNMLLQHAVSFDKIRMLQFIGQPTNPGRSLFATAIGNSQALRILIDFQEQVLPVAELSQAHQLQIFYDEALLSAAAKGYTKEVSLLLPKCAKHVQDQSGATPLHIAIQNKHETVVPILLHHKASLDATDSNGDTALYRAISLGLEATARALVEAGTAVDVKAVKLASETNLTDLTQLLEKKLPESLDWNDQKRLHSIDLFQAVKTEDCSKISTFVGVGAGVGSITDSAGQTPLHIAAMIGNADVVQALLNLKLDDAVIDAKTSNGDTALILAMKGGFEQVSQRIVEMLIKAGGNTRDAMAWTKSKKAFMWQAMLKKLESS